MIKVICCCKSDADYLDKNLSHYDKYIDDIWFERNDLSFEITGYSSGSQNDLINYIKDIEDIRVFVQKWTWIEVE